MDIIQIFTLKSPVKTDFYKRKIVFYLKYSKTIHLKLLQCYILPFCAFLASKCSEKVLPLVESHQSHKNKEITRIGILFHEFAVLYIKSKFSQKLKEKKHYNFFHRNLNSNYCFKQVFESSLIRATILY